MKWNLRLLLLLAFSAISTDSGAFPGVGALKTAFDPRSISGCRAWLRSDLGVTIATGVSTWKNQVSGVSGDATQATGAKQPTYSAGGVASLPKLSFSGTQGLQWALDLQGAKTLFVVMAVGSTFPSAGNFYSIVRPKGSTGPVLSEWVEINSGGYTVQSIISDYGAATVAASGFGPFLGPTGHIHIHTYNGGTNSSPASYTSRHDGIVETIVASSSFAGTTTDFGSIGARIDSGNNLTFGLVGDVYEVAAWNRALTTAETQQLYGYARARYATVLSGADAYKAAVLADSPLGYWRLGDGTVTAGSTAADASGNGLNGTYRNTWTGGATGAGVLVNDTAVTIGASGYVEVTGNPAALSLEYTHAMTLEAWVKATTVASQGILMGKLHALDGGAQNLRGYDIQFNASQSYLFTLFSHYADNYDQWAATLPTGLTITDGSWHQIVAAYDGDHTHTPALYFDGFSCTVTKPTNTLSATIIQSDNVRIGNFPSGAQVDSGTLIDEVAIYGTQLSQARVLAHYKASGNGI